MKTLSTSKQCTTVYFVSYHQQLTSEFLRDTSFKLECCRVSLDRKTEYWRVVCDDRCNTKMELEIQQRGTDRPYYELTEQSINVDAFNARLKGAQLVKTRSNQFALKSDTVSVSGYLHLKSDCIKFGGTFIPSECLTKCAISGEECLVQYSGVETNSDIEHLLSVRLACGDTVLESVVVDMDYRQHDGSWYSPDEAIPCRLAEYHSGGRHFEETCSENPFLIGFEIEKEDEFELHRLTNDGALTDELPQHWAAEYDGSLGCGGFEIVTQAYNLNSIDRIKADFNQMQTTLDSDTSSACGGHITISQRRISGYDLASDLKHVLPLLMVMYRERLNNEYVRSGTLSTLLGCSEKYRPFKITDSYIECRLFSAAKTKQQLLLRYELLKWILLVKPDYDTVLQSLKTEDSTLHKLLRKSVGNATVSKWAELFPAFHDFFNHGEECRQVEPYLYDRVR